MTANQAARILVVDDEPRQMKAICDILRDEGYVTLGFTSAGEALAALHGQSFDLLLTDLNMPDMDGIALLRAALEVDPNLVGIMMTGYAAIDTAVETMKAGALDYILKPFKLSAIKPILARALEVRRLRAENASLISDLERQTRLLKSILDCLGEGVAVANEKGELTLFNPAAEKIVGMGIQKAAPKEWTEIYGTYLPDRKTPFPGEAQPLARAVKGESTDNVEFFLRNASIPEGVDISVTGRPLVDAVGALLGGVVVFHDITQKKKSVEELKSLNQELEAFSYSVSHDLRAPLRHIGGFVEMLIKKEAALLSTEGQRYLNIVSEAAKKMGQLIDDLLHFSRVGRTDLTKQKVELRTLVQSAIAEVEQTAPGRRINWNIGELPAVNADQALLRLALLNLLSNAVKYTALRPAADIEVGYKGADNGKSIFFVRDNGAGFDMKYVGKLFGVFQRLHADKEFSGTGIGLANVRRIIHRHGGDTWAEGEVDKGACFYFSLPITEKG